MMMQKQGLYSPEYEHDACGIGFVVNIHGKRTHQTVKDGLKILANLAQAAIRSAVVDYTVDDVITTGSTMKGALSVLPEGLDIRIFACALTPSHTSEDSLNA